MGDACCNANVDVGNSRSTHVLLVDPDEQFARTVVQSFCHDDIAVTVAHNLAEARKVLHLGSPTLDVVLLELCLPDGRGESLLREFEACPRQPVVVITSTHLQDLQPEALEYRPVCVGKTMGTAALLKVVKSVVAGYATPAIRRFSTRFRLSQRETEVLALIAHGAKPKEIADRRHCSEQAVYAHLARACRKTHCLDYHQLVGKLFEFVCQSLGHTPPEHSAFIDTPVSSA